MSFATFFEKREHASSNIHAKPFTFKQLNFSHKPLLGKHFYRRIIKKKLLQIIPFITSKE
jgi:hypothetical protein